MRQVEQILTEAEEVRTDMTATVADIGKELDISETTVSGSLHIMRYRTAEDLKRILRTANANGGFFVSYRVC